MANRKGINMLLKLILASLFSRKWMVSLTCFSIAISMLILTSVSHIESQLRQNFERSVSGVDLIVGSRTSPLNLLLFSIFRMGYPSNNISWQSYSTIASSPQISWSVPIALGDSHKGYAVVGTTKDYFKHIKFADKQSISLQKGQVFTQSFELVLGAAVAKDLAYKLNDSIVLSHGAGKVSFTQHKNYPFVVVGILEFTGTPTDRAIFIPIEAVDTVHELASQLEEHTEHPGAISAALVGVNNKISLLSLQRNINQTKIEPLTAILPNVALQELWQIMSAVELSLKGIAILVLFASLIGMTTMLLASMRERQREIAVLRAVGARPSIIVLLVETEAIMITLVGCILGFVLLFIMLSVLQPYLIREYAFNINKLPDLSIFLSHFLLAISLAFLLGLIPAISSYKKSLSTGLRLM
jgi:putative ABC transport system permease protein